ncbi:hypothetical protein Fot_22560 [Forsythia ovata]|uniref:Uncharacterized protein n=1 Tax=Forsythia ovata TaxID=205694 RepID=A0ABD1UY27_9LAMI
MSSLHFSKVTKFKIRRGGVVEDISPPPPVPSAASDLGATVLQMPEMTRNNSSYIPPAPEVTSKVPSISIPARPVPLSWSTRQSEKKKAGAKSGEEAFWAPTSPLPDKYEYINIGSRRDELDPTVLGKLPPPAAKAAASIHKYWTSAFGKAADNAELTELLKLAEILMNCAPPLGDEDVEALRAENKDLREQLVFSEDARARATYDVIKARTIQKACVNAQKMAESQLKSCQNIIYAKDKELTEALNELSKAQGLLAKLEVPSYAEP